MPGAGCSVTEGTLATSQVRKVGLPPLFVYYLNHEVVLDRQLIFK